MESRRKFKNEQELLTAFKQEYDRINPKNKEEFDQKKSPDFPYLRAILKIYGLRYNELKVKVGVVDVLNPRRSKEEWQELLTNIIEELEYVPSTTELREKYGIARKSFYPHLGSYNNALKELDYEPLRDTPEAADVTKEELLEEYIDFSKRIGKLASYHDLDRDSTVHSSDIYTSRFGSIFNLKEEANKILNFKDVYFDNRSFTIEELKERLLIEKEKIGRRLTNREVQENKNLPSLNTFLRYFQTTKMREVWEEIEKH